MEDPANTFIKKNSITVSRNRPVALIANSCTYLGASLANHLLDKGIQVVAIDDLTVFDKRKIEAFAKNKDFHLLNLALDNGEILQKFQDLNLPRLDYGLFITDKSVPEVIVGRGIVNFVNLISEIRHSHETNAPESEEKPHKAHSDRPRLAFISSINLYGKSLQPQDRILKEAEVKFARGIKHFKLNGRVIRLAEIFGPGMDLGGDNPLSLLIEATIADKLDTIPTSLDFTQRSLYIDDAVALITKSVLSGSTSNKIYDGALLHPVKLSEIKQILSDPMWFEQQRAEITKLPEWPTPNLHKTIKELSWSPKTPVIKALRETVSYFKEHQEQLPKVSEDKKKLYSMDPSWSFAGTGFLEDGVLQVSRVPRVPRGEEKNRDTSKDGEFDKELKEDYKRSSAGKAKRFFWTLVIGGILIYGLIWPLIYLGYEAFNIKNHVASSKDFLEEGDFSQAEAEIQKAQASINIYQGIADNSKILNKIPGVKDYYSRGSQLLDLTQEGVDGVYFATRGSRSLFQTTKIISGESREDPQKYYDEASLDLDFASQKLSKVYASLGDDSLKKGFPAVLGVRIDDLRSQLGFYVSLVEQTRAASELMPKITGLEGKKSYLVLLQNNLELRPTGGFIGSYAKLDFENGRLVNIKVDDIYSLDGALKEVIAPPAELRADLGIDRLYLRDSNFDPDFPTAARQAEFFYKKEAGEPVHGVIALDLKASGNLLDAVGGLDLPEYGESVSGANLFERAISHAEANFFPGSQAKKNYLTSLQTQMFNKMFYLSKQNWPAIIQAISKSLQQKHILIYLEDPTLFSYLASSNWSGVFPRASQVRDGETNDFLAVIESNMGANKVNYFLQRKYDLQSSFTKEGKIQHKLKITYKNTSPSEIFPAGKYKNRIKIYTPIGTKLNKATFGEADITPSFNTLSDYGRTGFSALIEILPKEQKQLIFEYELKDPLNFKQTQALYKIEIFKQPGTMADPLDYSLTYPINFKLEEKPEAGTAGVQEVKIVTDMLTDRVFQFKVKQ